MEQSETYRSGEGRPRLKSLRWYGLVMGLLMMATFLAGGIFWHPASAAGIDGSKQQGKKCSGVECSTTVLGQISAINGTTLQMKDGKENSVITIKTTAQTEFVNKITHRKIALSDLKVNDFIQATGQMDSAHNLVSQSIVVDIEPSDKASDKGSKPKDNPAFIGYITAIHGSTLTVQSYKGAAPSIHTITVSATTELGSKLQDVAITLSELKTGDFIAAEGKVTGNGNLQATMLVVALPPDSHWPGK